MSNVEMPQTSGLDDWEMPLTEQASGETADACIQWHVWSAIVELNILVDRGVRK